MNTFAFELGGRVSLSLSGERGDVIGRAEYQNFPPCYQVSYVAADGRQCEGWFDSTALNTL